MRTVTDIFIIDRLLDARVIAPPAHSAAARQSYMRQRRSKLLVASVATRMPHAALSTQAESDAKVERFRLGRTVRHTSVSASS